MLAWNSFCSYFHQIGFLGEVAVLKIILPVLLASSLFCLGACSDDSPKHIDGLNFDNKAEADIAFNQSTVSCEDPSTCPASVAGMVLYYETQKQSYFNGSYTDHDISFCSAQLIAPDRVLTNRHCIPDIIAFQNADCRQNIMIKFPATSKHVAESVPCQKVLDFSAEYARAGENPRVLDWAVIQLVRSVNREIREVAKNGFPDKSQFSTYPTYYSLGKGYKGNKTASIGNGIIKRVDCITAMDNSMIYHYRNPHSPLFVGNCDYKVIGGNSGAGVYQDGKLAGLLSFALQKESMTLHRGFASKQVNNKMGGGTNLECIPYFNSNRPEFCHWDALDSTAKAIGTDFYLVHGLQADESEKEKMISFVENDSNIRWIPFELNFFTSAINEFNPYSRYGSESHYKMYAEEYARLDFARRFPFVPSCVDPQLKDENTVELKFPFYQVRLDEVELNKMAQMKVPMKLMHLSYQFEYDSAIDKFIGHIQRFETPTVRSRYHKLRDVMRNFVSRCFLDDRKSEYSVDCDRGKETYQELLRLKEQSFNGGAIFENEDLIEDYPSLDTIELSVCS